MFRQNIFCERLKLLRKTKQLSLTELAKEINSTKQTISNWENAYRAPSLEVTISLANYFDVSLDYLVGLSDNPKRN